MSFSNTVTPDGAVSLAEINPTIEPIVNENDYHLSSQESDHGEGEVIVVPNPVNHATGEMPSLEEFPGVYDFSLLMGACTVPEYKNIKKSWEYSLPMNKLFVKVGSAVPVSFRINNQLDWSELKVRGLLVYDNPDDSRKPVERCVAHRDPNHKSNQGYPDVNHVLCCQHSNATYACDKTSGRYSVLVPLGEPQAGATYMTILYALMCKSSCEGGVARRNTSIIFTLEKNNTVVGRHVVHVRICSCPKRDMNQELEVLNSERNNPISRGKKRKMPSLATGPIRIKSEGCAFNPAGQLFNNDVVLQPRFEPLNYMEVRSPAHFKILLEKAYELFKYRVTHQAAIYENLLKSV
ncbi:cellular tumor antigen p53 [Neocloeon triangulifer]|uniref:cellular tumor antigen p53 n=1 Tax=Neocloeon triangulifer TaxID=2078957 RepID=UPI00286F5332|nr:cellular tumor antigen p53 [Neocloeon triangulifer]